MPSKGIVLVFSMLWCLSAASRLTGETETDVDEGHGHDWDIFDINKEAGLDLVDGDIVIDEQKHHPRGAVSLASDSTLLPGGQPGLKTCINFVPWKGEENYIAVFKGTGCYSSVGNRQVGKQRLSIGRNCDRLATVEHEFLHALGFWHEQSRADRDDYVNIMWDRIEEGKYHNFLIHGESVSSALNVPYDYGSVMHYSKTAFNIGSEPSIITKIPSFMDVIGQRMEFSNTDLLKLNRLYNCTTSSTFLDSCSFEKENICGMIQGPGKGYFMHFSTVKGNHGDQAHLESSLFYSMRGSQCLQFYLHNSGGADDQLNVDSWELYHVTLDVKMKFWVVFEGLKGTGASTGGLSLDDINLSETTCPQHIWRIRDFTSLLAPHRQAALPVPHWILLPGSMAIYFHLTSGPKDDSLTWPCPWQQATMALMDQNLDIRQRMSNHRMIATDPNKLSSDCNEFYWDNPRKVGSLVNGSDGSQFYRGPGTGTSSYLTHGRMKSRNFIKGDDARHYSEKSAVVSPSQETTNTSTVVMAVSMSLAAVMFVVAMASMVYARRSESDVIVVENIDI
ncbi:unnamed protein product, partial [Coregonus sp. 'balchen']